MLTGSVTWPAGSRASQVVGVKSDVIAEAVGSDAESQGCPAVHGRCEGAPIVSTAADTTLWKWARMKVQEFKKKIIHSENN